MYVVEYKSFIHNHVVGVLVYKPDNQYHKLQ